MLGLGRVLGPLPRLLILIGNALTPGKGFSEGPFSSEAELRELVDLAEALERDRVRRAQDDPLGLRARRHHRPRGDGAAHRRGLHRAHKTLRQAMSLFLRSGFSRIPVVGEDLDDIIGFAYLKDVSKRVFDRQAARDHRARRSVMRPVFHVPDSKPVDDLLREMQAQRRHIAVVVDEYGGTAGIVTIEDILEEIVGEITDEFDTEEAGVEDAARRVQAGLRAVPGRRPRRDRRRRLRGRRGRLRRRPDGQAPRQGPDPGLDASRSTGWLFMAEEAKGRRNRIGTVLITPVVQPGSPGRRSSTRATARCRRRSCSARH